MWDFPEQIATSSMIEFIVEQDDTRMILRAPNGYGLSVIQSSDANGFVANRYSICPVKVSAPDNQLTFVNDLNLPYSIYEMYMDQTFNEVGELFQIISELVISE